MDNVTRAKINLFAVLRNFEDLCSLDPVSKELIAKSNLGVEFNVPEVGSAVISFKDGKCTFSRGKGKSALKLYFLSAEHFNKLIDGDNTIPLFYNVFKVGFLLKEFMGLADRLNYYLQPKEEEKAALLENPEYFDINTRLTAYTAFFAMAEIANSDFVGKAIAKRIPNCQLSVTVGGGPEAILVVKNNKMTCQKGLLEEPDALMCLSDMQFAHDLLNGNTSSFTGLGEGKFAIAGRPELLEQVAKLLSQVAIYLG